MSTPADRPIITFTIVELPGGYEQPLRLGQRNDGYGPRAHPRLLSSPSGPSSRQRSAAPRVGDRNRYR